MKPNIIIFMTDQQRADLRQKRGFSLDTMPFLDSWSEKGTDFQCAYTSNPTCMPARVSMFTGRYPESHRVRTNHNMRDALYTKDMLDVFKENGYITAICGKNHSHRQPSDFDFQSINGHLGGEGETNTSEEEQLFADFLRSTDHMETYAPSPGGIEVQFPYRNISDALEFLDQCKSSPFFLWVSLAEPHNPFQVPSPYFDMFLPDELPKITGKEALDSKSEKFKWLRGVWEHISPDIDQRIARSRSNYYGMLNFIDSQFKRLVEGVEERNLTENTYIIYLSDHGDFAGEYGLLRKGPELPQILSNIPMIWSGPDIISSNSNACVNIVDIFPTVCDIMGVDVPDGVQGKSILPLLTGQNIPNGEFDVAYSESGFGGLNWNESDGLDILTEGASFNYKTFDCLNSWTQSGKCRMVRKGNFKLQLSCDNDGQGYLYDLSNDPLELKNLWNIPEYSEKRAEMTELLAREIMKHYDVLPYPRHRYRVKLHPKGYTEQEFISKDTGVRSFSYHINKTK